MIIDPKLKLDFCDVLLVPTESDLESRKQVSLSRSFHFRWSKNKISCIPVCAANMHKTGTLRMARVLSSHGMITCLSKHIEPLDIDMFLEEKEENEYCLNYVAFSSGSRKDDICRIVSLLEKYHQVKMVCLDVANGYCKSFLNFIKDFRKDYPDKIIIAGNVVTSDQACKIIENGADIVKVGIGSGSVCTTRRMTGIGYPQLSAIVDMQKNVHECGGLIMSDGGCQNAGDIAKALAANSDFVMIGGMLAGHDECIHSQEEDHTVFYGMSSYHAMENHYGNVSDYRASEGKIVSISSKGPVENTVKEILGGMRSACTYLNASSIDDISKNASFIQVNRQLNGMFS